jgi:hypothetical protein
MRILFLVDYFGSGLTQEAQFAQLKPLSFERTGRRLIGCRLLVDSEECADADVSDKTA